MKDRRVTEDSDLRGTLRRALPPRIAATLEDYAAFAAGEAGADAKLFAAHHAACKAALAHAEMLVRLLKWAEAGAAGGLETGEPGTDAGTLLARARAALDEDFQEGPEGPEDDDTP